MSWPRTAAIFRAARHPAAAKLYLAWQLSVARQRTVLQWPSRRDVPLPAGWNSISHYNSPMTGFREFMRDRATVERYRAIVKTFIAPQAMSREVQSRDDKHEMRPEFIPDEEDVD